MAKPIRCGVGGPAYRSAPIVCTLFSVVISGFVTHSRPFPHRSLPCHIFEYVTSPIPRSLQSCQSCNPVYSRATAPVFAHEPTHVAPPPSRFHSHTFETVRVVDVDLQNRNRRAAAGRLRIPRPLPGDRPRLPGRPPDAHRCGDADRRWTSPAGDKGISPLTRGGGASDSCANSAKLNRTRHNIAVADFVGTSIH